MRSPLYASAYARPHAYVRNDEKPDFFITLTCNLQLEKIKPNLHPNNTTPQDRHDLISRVFHLKLQKLMYLINKGDIFGLCKCLTYTTEWQKRELPHAHLLIWLENKLRPDQIDDVIRAKISDPVLDPHIHVIVMKHMVHGPCGYLNERSLCMKMEFAVNDTLKNFDFDISRSCALPNWILEFNKSVWHAVT